VYALLKPLLFRLDPHSAHAIATAALAPLEHVVALRAMTRAIAAPRDARVATRVLGLDFASPVGLAGGFDKDAQRPRALAALGFGFLELGTVTARAQAANPRPNMFRLPADRALVNRLGFPNDGASAVVARFVARGGTVATRVPVAISIGKSRDVPLDPLEGVVDDYVASFREAARAADFVVVNVSSPNTKDLRKVQGAELARALFAAIVRERDASDRKLPVLVKVAPDLSDADLDALLAVVEETKLDGVVATNTTIARAVLLGAGATAPLATDAREVEAIGAGGLSGPPLRARALEVVRRVRARLGRRVAVIGVGGIETGEHAMAFVRAGADLVQLYTGFIYGGPLTASRIARELAREVERAGAKTIAELVGVSA
jgi:dihydroorotate dehydrogenase